MSNFLKQFAEPPPDSKNKTLRTRTWRQIGRTLPPRATNGNVTKQLRTLIGCAYHSGKHIRFKQYPTFSQHFLNIFKTIPNTSKSPKCPPKQITKQSKQCQEAQQMHVFPADSNQKKGPESVTTLGGSMVPFKELR